MAEPLDYKAALVASPGGRSVRSAGSDRWADIQEQNERLDHDEESQDTQAPPSSPREGVEAATMEDFQTDEEEIGIREGGFDSAILVETVGGQLHGTGRCKPCAFFHTKGCKSGADCVFCHMCPPHEKQRRKRLRRHINQALRNPANPAAKELQEVTGHSRQPSTCSAATASTATTARQMQGGQGNHSRQWSVSTQGSAVGGASFAPMDSSAVQSDAQPMRGTFPSPSGMMPAPPVAPAPTDADLDRWAARAEANGRCPAQPMQWRQDCQPAHWQQADMRGGYAMPMQASPVGTQVSGTAAGMITCNGQQYALVPVEQPPYEMQAGEPSCSQPYYAMAPPQDAYGMSVQQPMVQWPVDQTAAAAHWW